MRTSCTTWQGRQHASARGAEPVVPTEAPHHGHGAATRRRGVEPVVPTEAPQQRPGRRQPLQNFYRGIGDRTIFAKIQVFRLRFTIQKQHQP